MSRISSRERESVLRSLSSGVVPAIGLHHIQVGRLDEVNAMIQDLDQVERGGTFVRFIVGRYGSGKTFFLHLLKNVALQRKFVVLEADITTDRRLHGSGGKGRGIYTELMRLWRHDPSLKVAHYLTSLNVGRATLTILSAARAVMMNPLKRHLQSAFALSKNLWRATISIMC